MKIIKYILCFLLLLITITITSCSNTSDNLVITSFYANNEITKELTKDTNIEVKCLINGAIEPHDYEPSAKQRAQMEDAKLIIVNGLGLEEYLETLESSDKLKDKICYSNSEVDALESDPHSFVSPKEAIIITKTISKSLQDNFNNYKEIIQKNEDKLVETLEEISKDYKNFFDTTSNLYVLGHSAYSYLNRDYNMNTKCVLGLHEEEPTASKISEICDYINKNNISTIFGEYFEENDTINTIARSTNTNVSYLYTLEMMDDSNLNYVDALKINLENLKINF